MPRLLRIILPVLALLAAAAGLTVAAAPAYAATLTSVSSFGSNPGNLTMYSYRPDGVASGAPLVVAMHGRSAVFPTHSAPGGQAGGAARDSCIVGRSCYAACRALAAATSRRIPGPIVGATVTERM